MSFGGRDGGEPGVRVRVGTEFGSTRVTSGGMELLTPAGDQWIERSFGFGRGGVGGVVVGRLIL